MKVFKLFQPRQKIVNIVVKDHVIRYVELKQTKSPVLYKFGERYLPEGIIHEGKINDREMLEMILSECVAEWKLKNRRIRFIVPDQFIIIRQISLPKDLEDDEVRGYLFMELGATIHLPFEEPVFDYFIYERTENKLNILLFAAPEQLVADYAQLFEEVKLKPVAADVSPLCLYRLFYAADQAKTNDHLLLVQADLSAVSVSVFHKHHPIFLRQLLFESHFAEWEKKTDTSGKTILRWNGEVEEPLRQLEDVYKEIERVMNFYRFSIRQGKEQITRILLTGDHPYLSQIYEVMSDRFDVPVVRIPEDVIATPDGKPIDCSYHLPLGLALKEGTS